MDIQILIKDNNMEHKTNYVAPGIEMLDVMTEQGFALSLSTEDYDETTGSWNNLNAWN